MNYVTIIVTGASANPAFYPISILSMSVCKIYSNFWSILHHSILYNKALNWPRGSSRRMHQAISSRVFPLLCTYLLPIQYFLNSEIVERHLHWINHGSKPDWITRLKYPAQTCGLEEGVLPCRGGKVYSY